MNMINKLISRLLKALPALLVLAAWSVINFSPLLARAEPGPRHGLTPGTFSVRVERPLGGWISADMAREAALAAARREAAARVRPDLARIPEVAGLLEESAALVPGPEEQGREQMLELVARFLLEADEPPRESGGGQALALEQGFSLGGIDMTRQKLALLLSAPALLENYRLALQLESTCLARYDATVAALLAQPGQMSGDGEGGAAGAVWQEVAALHNALRACGIYLEILPALYAEGGLSPELLEPLEEINRLLPGNYLFLSELGRFYLWLERSGRAGQALDAALRLNPDFDQAYGHRGALWLLLHKPSLALADFDRAIRLASGRPEMEAVYRHGRAVVWKALGNNAGMCEDLRQSCLLGQCAAYEWAVAGKECQ